MDTTPIEQVSDEVMQRRIKKREWYHKNKERVLAQQRAHHLRKRGRKTRAHLSREDQERMAVAIRHVYNTRGSNITKSDAVRQALDVCWPGGAPIKATTATVTRYWRKAMALPNPGNTNGNHREPSKSVAEGVCTLTAPGLSITLDLGKLPMLLHAIAYAVADKAGGES